MNNSFTNWKRTVKTVASADAGGEYILYNDKPDVKRVVHVLSAVKKNGCYLSDKTVSADGEITYSILYTGDDGELHSVTYRCPISAEYKLKDGEEGDFSYAEILSTDTQLRLSNPRKFSIKSRTQVEFSVFSREEITPYIEGVQDNGLQYDEKTGVTYSVSSERDDNIPLSIDVHIPDNLPEPASVVCSYAVPGMPTVTPYDSKAEVSFCVDFLFICRGTDGELFSFCHTADVSHEIDADGITPGSVCRANVCTSDVSCNLTTDTAGEMRVIETDLTYDVEVLYETAMNGVYISDMFSTEYESRETFSDMTLRRALPVTDAHYTVSGTAENENGCDIVASTAGCDKYSLSPDKNGAAVFPNAKVYVSVDEWKYWKPIINKQKPNELQRQFRDAYNGRIQTLNPGEPVVPRQVYAMMAAGHTPGHCFYRQGKLRFVGDVVHAVDLQIEHPEYCASFDNDAKQAYGTRLSFLKTMSKEGCIVFGAHIPFPGVGYIVKSGDGYRFDPYQSGK